jgi:hypothetical protein
VDRFFFWQRWLVVVSVVVTAFGLLLALFNQTPLFDFFVNQHVNRVFWGSDAIDGRTVTFQKWIYGVLGATVTGWGVVLAFLAHHSIRRREGWAWACVITGLLVWFIPDTIISLYFGVVLNALFNVVLLVAILVPLLAMRRHFARGHE